MTSPRISPYDDAWPGTVELELLAVESQLNDPRTQSVAKGFGPRDAPERVERRQPSASLSWLSDAGHE